MTDTQLQCAHDKCRCRVDESQAFETNGKVYCCSGCADSSDGEYCGCGHSDCGLVSPSPDTPPAAQG